MRVTIWLVGSDVDNFGDVVHNDVDFTSVSSGMFQVFLDEGVTFKYPIMNILKIREKEIVDG